MPAAGTSRRSGSGRGGRAGARRHNDNNSQKSGVGRGGHAELFGVVTCRAVASMTKLSGWTLPLLMPGGRLVALKGRSAQAEIEKAEKVIRQFGGAHARVVEAPVGPGLEPTHVVIVDKR